MALIVFVCNLTVTNLQGTFKLTLQSKLGLDFSNLYSGDPNSEQSEGIRDFYSPQFKLWPEKSP